jgi:hypothetical protein
MVTADTAGRLKLWDISAVNWRKDGQNGQTMATNMREKWFIQAHKSIVNSLEIVESFQKKYGHSFILSGGQDCNILLHKMNGEKLGQFG